MIYDNAQQWQQAERKQVLLFGMSGLGKTHISNILRESGGWFHYSVDYRIGTRYMDEYIVDNFKREAMHNPFLARLLRSDSIYIASNITFDNLTPLSTYLGKPGDPTRGGIPIAEYRKRQEQHFVAEISALMDTTRFIERARELYGYDNFVCDSGGSICEVVDPYNPENPLLKALSQNLLMVWIRGGPEHVDMLAARFEKSPKPMYFRPEFLEHAWAEYCARKGVTEDQVDPDDFMRFAYRACLNHRQPLYRAMAENWGVTVDAADIARVRSAGDFDALIARALDARASQG